MKRTLHAIIACRQIRGLGIMELLLCCLLANGQQVDTRAAVRAKAEAARLSRASAAVVVPHPTATNAPVTFDVPGAVNGTFPMNINNAAAIAGYYGDNVGSGFHGFLRTGWGSYSTFDVTGAVNGTFAQGINNNGTITGYYGDDVGSGFHGFVRDSRGAISTFDAPGAVNGTFPSAINEAGAVTGFYADANIVLHGFLLDHNGFTTVDFPGALNGTIPSSITPNEVIMGTYSDANSLNSSFGFQRTPSGTFNTIDGPDNLSGQVDPLTIGPPISINPEGVIAGTYFEPISGNPFGGNFRVFVRSAQGMFITFDAASYPPCCIWSAPSGINPMGTVTGSYNDGFSINHGFVRTLDGSLTTFDAPGAGTGYNQGTLPIGITPAGVIAGQYRDSQNITHGFIFRP